MPGSNKTAIILKAGLFVGTLDITFALVEYYLKTGNDPANVLRYVASAIFGKPAFAGGTMMAITGLLLHYLIAFSWTIVFFFIYLRMPLLRINVIATAILYGVFIWIVMQLVILPLSLASTGAFDLKQSLIAVLNLVLAIGLPLSIITKKYYSQV